MPTAFSHPLKPVLLGLLAVLFAANGLWMVADPPGWYAGVPGVTNTGPFNVHFVRDIGLAYLTFGLAMAAALAVPRAALPLAGVVTLWLALHGVLHLWDVAAARLPIDHLIIDLPGVFAPAVIGLFVTLWLRPEWRGAAR